MKNYLLGLLFLPLMCLSQTHRFIYEYQFKRDSAIVDYTKNNMVLDVNPDDVKFYIYDQIEVDSINKIKGVRSSFWDDELPTISRKRNTSEHNNYYQIEGFFKVISQDPINWTLSQETKEVAGYHLQKATCQFGGRFWTAWFTKDIPINEGPYKFRGLPGLIFQISDSREQFNFTLLKSYKLGKTYDTTSFIETFAGQPAIAITEKRLTKLKLDYYHNPLNRFKENFKTKAADDRYFVLGVEVKSADQFKELTKRTQDNIRKNNNPIEIDKAILYP